MHLMQMELNMASESSLLLDCVLCWIVQHTCQRCGLGLDKCPEGLAGIPLGSFA